MILAWLGRESKHLKPEKATSHGSDEPVAQFTLSNKHDSDYCDAIVGSCTSMFGVLPGSLPISIKNVG